MFKSKTMEKAVRMSIVVFALIFCILLSSCGASSVSDDNPAETSTSEKSSVNTAEDIEKLSAFTSYFKSLDDVEQFHKGYQIYAIEFYREDGQIIRKELYDTTSNGDLYVDYVYEYDFDDDGKVTSVREKSWRWNDYLTLEEYLYDDAGLLERHICYHSNDTIREIEGYLYYDDGALYVNYKTEYDYDNDTGERTESRYWFDEYSEDGILVADEYISEDEDWTYDNRAVYTYDENGRVVSADEYVNEELYGHDYYTYDQFGNLVQKTEWMAGIKTYSYDDNNRLVYENVVYGDGSGHTIRYQYYPLTNSVAKKEISFGKSGETEDVTYETTQKDSNDNIILRVTTDTDGTEYVSELNTYEYYDNGNIKIKRIYVDGSWYFNREEINDEIEYFKYSESK